MFLLTKYPNTNIRAAIITLFKVTSHTMTMSHKMGLIDLCEMGCNTLSGQYCIKNQIFDSYLALYKEKSPNILLMLLDIAPRVAAKVPYKEKKIFDKVVGSILELSK